MKVRNDFQFLEIERSDSDTKPLGFRTHEFGEIYRPISNRSAEQQAGRCLSCAIPYCEVKCPVHNYIPNWLQLLAENRIYEAAELCQRTNSLPEICGRVCPQDRLCEGACTLNTGFGAVTIGSAEKYIVDTALAMGWVPALPPEIDTDLKVAVVGSGPAGLGCADILRQNGIDVCVYEKNSEVGGLLTFGIPEFKLEKRVVARRRGLLERAGVEFVTNTSIGTDIAASQLLQDYDAVFLAMGTYSARHGSLPGREAKGVYSALDYLSAQTAQLHKFDYESDFINLHDKQVVVLGGGDTGMDCNRTAIRQGARSVTCLYRRDHDNMPGSRKEINHCYEEGVNFAFQKLPLRILKNDAGTAIGVEVIETQATQSATDGRIQFEPIAGTEQVVSAEAILISYGFDAEPFPWLKDLKVEVDDRGLIEVPQTPNVSAEVQQRLPFQTSNPKVFSGGDIVWGADLVVTAVDAGRRAGKAIADMLLDQGTS